MATGKIRFKILKTRISGFWNEYKRSKVGILGLFMVAGFVFLAIFGPSLAPYDPKIDMLAAPLAVPQWLTILPQYKDLPPTIYFNVEWTSNLSDIFDFQFKEDSALAAMLGKEKVYVWSVRYTGNSTNEVEFKLSYNFDYNYAPPDSFKCSFKWRVLNLSEAGYNLELALGYYGDQPREYSLWDNNFKTAAPKRSTTYSYTFDMPGAPSGYPRYVELNSGLNSLYKGRLDFNDEKSFINEVFSSKGCYALMFYIRLKPKTNVSTFEVQIFDFAFVTRGKTHGLLGTDDRGRDVFSQLLYGTRVSFMVGGLVAVLATSFGVLVGTLSGYFGGFVDELSMRIVDLLMCLPVLPLLLATVDMFGRNLIIAMLIIVFLSWMALARMIRSQVLSLREMAFVEAAVASGCSRLNILAKHIVPNVLPLAFSYMILSVPGAILIEASLSFLGLGDPQLISWGRMMNEAMRGGALAKDAWWWIFTPGIAIVLVCLSFVFVSFAFDRIVNPRLRARR